MLLNEIFRSYYEYGIKINHLRSLFNQLNVRIFYLVREEFLAERTPDSRMDGALRVPHHGQQWAVPKELSEVLSDSSLLGV